MRRELEEQKAQQRAIVDRENLAQATELQSRSFKECLAKMMSTDLINVEPYEEVIRERLQNLMVELQTKDKVSGGGRYVGRVLSARRCAHGL